MSKVLRVSRKFDDRIRIFRDDLDVETQLALTDGQPYGGREPIEMVKISILGTSRQSDFHEVGNLLFCTERLKNTISESTNKESQFFKVDSDLVPGVFETDDWSRDYFLWNITKNVKTIDIVDRKNGKFRLSKGKKGRKVSEIKVLALKENEIGDDDLFRLWPDSELIIVGDKLAEHISKAKLTGVELVSPDQVGSEFDFDDI